MHLSPCLCLLLAHRPAFTFAGRWIGAALATRGSEFLAGADASMFTIGDLPGRTPATFLRSRDGIASDQLAKAGCLFTLRGHCWTTVHMRRCRVRRARENDASRRLFGDVRPSLDLRAHHLGRLTCPREVEPEIRQNAEKEKPKQDRSENATHCPHAFNEPFHRFPFSKWVELK